jgi:hypothetical protein
MGRIIQILHEDLTGARCPNNRWGGADCTLSYDATVTFDKFADFEEPAGPPAPRARGDAAGAHRVGGHGPRADVVPVGLQGARRTTTVDPRYSSV